MKKFEQLGRSLSKEDMKKVLGGGDAQSLDGGEGIACGDKKCGGGDNSQYSLTCHVPVGGTTCTCPRTDYSWSDCSK